MSNTYKYWLGFRSVLFYIGFALLTVVFSITACLLAPVPLRQRQNIATFGNHLSMKWLRLTCNIRIAVEGRDNVPDKPCVFLSNHQSTWETFYLQWELRPVCTILKRELLRIPFFGWGLAMMHPIAIDRSNPRDAMRQVATAGKQRLAEGLNIIVYPQGTRTPYGTTRPFARSGAALALESGVPVVPIAHNAGAHWPNNSFIKYPGTIRIIFGKPITNADDSKQLTADVQAWVEAQLNAIEESQSPQP